MFEVALVLPFLLSLLVFWICYQLSSEDEHRSGRTAIASLVNIGIGVALCYCAAFLVKSPGTDIILFYAGAIFAGVGVIGICLGFALNIVNPLLKKRKS